uniref:Phosphatidylethanolamine-binding protein 4 n=1 Tax=Strix occidentalis caurina TaxID=311401 RepID=A0A8D0ETC1_STROC
MAPEVTNVFCRKFQRNEAYSLGKKSVRTVHPADLTPCPTAQAWLGRGINTHPLHGVFSPYILFSPSFLPRGDVEIIYPELGDVGCTYIPKCHRYRRRISREWGSPRVRYPQADKKYVLVLVDPDAPSRANPRNRFWRHWLVTDIPVSSRSAGQGWELQRGAWAMESFEKQFQLGSPVASTQFLTKYYED